MKEKALKLADELDKASEYLRCIGDADFKECANMIRRLVAELEEVTRQSSDVSSKPLSDEETLEILAEIEHEQWMAWAKTLYEKEPLLSLERRQRWHDCFKPYAELSEEMKEHDRVWARKVIRAIEERHGIK